MSEIDIDWPEMGRKAMCCDVIHKRPEQYLAELLMINENDNLRNIPSFWTLKEYHIRYMNRLLEAKRHIDTAEFKFVNNAVVKNKLTDLSQPAAKELIILEILQS